MRASVGSVHGGDTCRSRQHRPARTHTHAHARTHTHTHTHTRTHTRARARQTTHPQLLHLLLVLLDVHRRPRAARLVHGGRLCRDRLCDGRRRLAADAHVVLAVKRDQLRLGLHRRLLGSLLRGDAWWWWWWGGGGDCAGVNRVCECIGAPTNPPQDQHRLQQACARTTHARAPRTRAHLLLLLLLLLLVRGQLLLNRFLLLQQVFQQRLAAVQVAIGGDQGVLHG
jgi:hypothetical protein